MPYSTSEADEASKGDALVALANLRWQVLGNETNGVIDMYAAAAVRCGVANVAVSRFIQQVRDTLGLTPAPGRRSALLIDLSLRTRDYLSRRLPASAFASSIGYFPALA